MNTKYELTDETIVLGSRTLHRIRALRDIPVLGCDVEKGTLGGFVESEDNLSYADTDGCWIFGNAKVYGKAIVKDWARVAEEAEISGDVIVKDFALIGGQTRLCGAEVIGDQERIPPRGIITKAPHHPPKKGAS